MAPTLFLRAGINARSCVLTTATTAAAAAAWCTGWRAGFARWGRVGSIICAYLQNKPYTCESHCYALLPEDLQLTAAAASSLADMVEHYCMHLLLSFADTVNDNAGTKCIDSSCMASGHT